MTMKTALAFAVLVSFAAVSVSAETIAIDSGGSSTALGETSPSPLTSSEAGMTDPCLTYNGPGSSSDSYASDGGAGGGANKGQ